jgi:hypothetical protein
MGRSSDRHGRPEEMVRQAANTVCFRTSLEAGFDATRRILTPRGRPSSDLYAEGGYDLQEYAYRYLYGADRERSNVGDQKIAVL